MIKSDLRATLISLQLNALFSREYKEGMLVFNSSTHGMDPAHWEMHSILVVNGPSIVKGRRVGTAEFTIMGATILSRSFRFTKFLTTSTCTR